MGEKRRKEDICSDGEREAKFVTLFPVELELELELESEPSTEVERDGDLDVVLEAKKERDSRLSEVMSVCVDENVFVGDKLSDFSAVEML